MSGHNLYKQSRTLVQIELEIGKDTDSMVPGSKIMVYQGFLRIVVLQYKHWSSESIDD